MVHAGRGSRSRRLRARVAVARARPHAGRNSQPAERDVACAGGCGLGNSAHRRAPRQLYSDGRCSGRDGPPQIEGGHSLGHHGARARRTRRAHPARIRAAARALADPTVLSSAWHRAVGDHSVHVLRAFDQLTAHAVVVVFRLSFSFSGVLYASCNVPLDNGTYTCWILAPARLGFAHDPSRRPVSGADASVGVVARVLAAGSSRERTGPARPASGDRNSLCM